MTFGRKTEEDEAIRLVACAADAGNTFPGDRTPGAGRETESGPDIAGPLGLLTGWLLRSVEDCHVRRASRADDAEHGAAVGVCG